MFVKNPQINVQLNAASRGWAFLILLNVVTEPEFSYSMFEGLIFQKTTQNGSSRKTQLRAVLLGKSSRAAPHLELPVPLTEALCAGSTVTPRCDVFARGCGPTQSAPEHTHWLLPSPKLLWHVSVRFGAAGGWFRSVWTPAGVICAALPNKTFSLP